MVGRVCVSRCAIMCVCVFNEGTNQYPQNVHNERPSLNSPRHGWKRAYLSSAHFPRSDGLQAMQKAVVVDSHVDAWSSAILSGLYLGFLSQWQEFFLNASQGARAIESCTFDGF